MLNLDCNDYKLTNCQRINIIFGKNGCGKSTALKAMTTALRSKNLGIVRYTTPERGGILLYQPNVESNMQNPGWSDSLRNKNQFANFKEQTVVIFKDWRATISKHLEDYIKEHNTQTNISTMELEKRSFTQYINKLNSLLDNVEIRQEKSTFKIFSKEDNKEIPSDSISSGESELITLGIECLSFLSECKPDKINILFLDEPDVHIHPDLQAKLMHFLKELVDTEKLIVFIATHSTALLGALENYEHVGFNFMTKRKKDFTFERVSKEYKDILPIFGAHPLSNIYCSTPIFLVEGEDDVWVWQKAIRTSGTLKIFPCDTDGVNNMPRYENKVNEIIESVYDSKSALAYSLRDRDDHPESKNLDDYGKLNRVKRFMLSCRCAENLFLSDDVLLQSNMTWISLQAELDNWLSNNNNSHPKYDFMHQFKSNKYDRKQFKDIKEIINIIVGLITTKPWQVLVGQQIGNIVKAGTINNDLNNNHSLASYLGSELIAFLLVPR